MGGDSLVTGTFIVASMTCTVIGNLLLKTGAGERGVSTIWPFSLLNMNTFLGAMAFGMAMVFYLMVLKRTSLNLAQSIFALQFVLVIFAAHLVLGEPIGTYRWIGIALIALGLFVVALSPNATLR
jgi:undecaprenyl phosphate-alpha-L-ara4N flippase subunit ArnE